MNTEHPLLGTLVVFAIVFLILSYAIGTLIGGPASGKKIVKAEVNFASQIARALVKEICAQGAKFLLWVRKQL
jgi:hypothetical protein